MATSHWDFSLGPKLKDLLTGITHQANRERCTYGTPTHMRRPVLGGQEEGEGTEV